MKGSQIESWFALNRSTPGRRGHCATRIEAASSARWARIAALCAPILQREREQIVLQGRFKAGQALNASAQWTPELVSVDVTLDRQIGAMRDVLAALGKRQGARGEAAKRLLDRYFAQGVDYYTQQIFEDESARVGGLVQGLDGDSADVAAASVEDYVSDVKATHNRYAALIAGHDKPERVAWDDVKAADLANQRAFLELVAAIFAETRELAEAERDAARKELLRVVDEHDAEISALVAARRRVRDVDPDSGQPEPSDND